LCSTALPRTTYPGIIQRLTISTCSITITVTSTRCRHDGNLQGRKSARPCGRRLREREEDFSADVMEKKQRKIAALMQGQTIPFMPVSRSAFGTTPRRPQRQNRRAKECGEQHEWRRSILKQPA